MSGRCKLNCLPFGKPLYGIVVFCAHIKIELVANPENNLSKPFSIPFAAPNKLTNKNIPQPTPIMVRKVRSLLFLSE